ncbi:MAG TPA: addiction module protein [Urbifossiella sp.]|jgi:putative addiction module component (TIGR02574 family)|nr:addiction module protein [Urbifossiella sp.]
MSDSHRDFDYTQLSVDERILLVQDIWDSVAEETQAFPLTIEQRRELDRRIAAADRGEMTYSSWEDVKRRLLPGE